MLEIKNKSLTSHSNFNKINSNVNANLSKEDFQTLFLLQNKNAEMKNNSLKNEDLANLAFLKMNDFQTLAPNNNKATLFGYSVDENGFMGADFNKKAGLPSDFKIHKETLEKMHKTYVTPNTMSMPSGESANFTLQNGVYYAGAMPLANGQSYFNKLDIASVFKWAYTQLEPLIKDSTKNAYNLGELQKYFPAGIAYDSGEITKIYQNQEELESAMHEKDILFNLGLSNGAKNLFFVFEKDGSINESDLYMCDESFSIKQYINENNISKEGLLVAFMAQQGAVFKAQSPETIKSEYQKALENFEKFYYGGDSVSNYNAIKAGALSIDDFIESSLECNLWLYYYFMQGNKEPHLLPSKMNLQGYLEWDSYTPKQEQRYQALNNQDFMDYLKTTIKAMVG
ncbi:Cj0814 family flagellar-dependent secreted protein [Helicobacter ganmani]|uniref:Uncharacterized protein n=2 Tax=Helicobacter ganmani TaxID=60246 RepID=A0A3D8IA72_9HELI|nr:hypothetical protein [Helicobacter ganmani]RDU61421.1 hypothetical protein CQA43_09310 [Helicobacter ganmani]